MTRSRCLVFPAAVAIAMAGALAPSDAHARKKKPAGEQKLSAACDDDDGEACAQLAEKLLDDSGVAEKSARRAIALLERACELKDSIGCSRLSREVEHGVWVKNDPVRAAELAGKGCNLGDIPSCVALGVAYLNGRGVEQSYAKAVPHLNHACKEEDAEGCFQMGAMILEGKGGPPDPSKAQGFLEKGCDLESGAACNRIGQLFLAGQAPPSAGEVAGKPSLKKAARFFTAGCDLDNADACTALGKMRLAGQGMGMDEDVAKELFEKACTLGDGWACVESGASPQDGTVVEGFRKRCDDARDARSCFAVGAALLKSGDDKKCEQGASYLQTACDGGVPRACHKLAFALEKGEVLPKDLNRSQKLFRKACDGGFKKACNR